MVNWSLKSQGKELQFTSGKIILASPCLTENQNDFLQDLQSSYPDFKLLQENIQYRQSIPKLIGRSILRLDGRDLQHRFNWWIGELKVVIREEDSWCQMIPSDESGWTSMLPEKKLLLFSAAAIMSAEFSMLFLQDINLDQKAQNFLFNFLRGMVQREDKQLMIFWSLRCQIPQALPFYFGGVKKNAA